MAALVHRFDKADRLHTVSPHVYRTRFSAKRYPTEPGPMSNQSPAWVLGLVPRSEIAELLLAPDDCLGRPYALFTLRNGAKLLTPKKGAARRGGLAIYNPQMAAGLAAKGLMWTGIWPGQAVSLRSEPLEELRQVWRELHRQLQHRTGAPVWRHSDLQQDDCFGDGLCWDPAGLCKACVERAGAGGFAARGRRSRSAIERRRPAWSGSWVVRRIEVERFSPSGYVAWADAPRAIGIRRCAPVFPRLPQGFDAHLRGPD